jgi:hypothetical protein
MPEHPYFSIKLLVYLLVSRPQDARKAASLAARLALNGSWLRTMMLRALQ